MLPAADTAPCARLFAALLGSHWADDAGKAVARHLEEIAPGCGALVRETRAWHQRVSMWALGQGCRGGIICGAGLPASPEAYRSPSGTVLPGWWVLADPDMQVTVTNWLVRTTDAPGRVTAIQGSASDPAGILARPEAKAIRGRMCVHARFGAMFWPAGVAAEAVAGWGRGLPPGSVFALSAWLADRSVPEGREFTAALGDGVQSHSAEDVRGWFRDAPRLRVRQYVVRRCAAGAVATVVAVAG